MSDQLLVCHALDIGGTLTKCVSLVPQTSDSEADDWNLSVPFELLTICANENVTLQQTYKFTFRYSPTCELEKFLENLKAENFSSKLLPLTGGGAYKYQQMIESKLETKIIKVDEIKALMAGFSFLLRYPEEMYEFNELTRQMTVAYPERPIYPIILTNVGSGVSILKANSESEFIRLTGTCIGGGTVLGLSKLLIGAESFEDVVALAETGSRRLDLNVADLFGDSAGSSCLPEDTLASSFGKLYVNDGNLTHSLAEEVARPEDVARSLVDMVSYNLGYLAYLIGTIHGVTRVVFTGKYVNNKITTMDAINYAVHFYARQYGCSVGNVPHSTRIDLTDQSPMACKLALPLSLHDSPPSTSCRRSTSLSRREHILFASDSEAPSPRLASMESHFEVLSLRHDGYLGALGALVLGAKEAYDVAQVWLLGFVSQGIDAKAVTFALDGHLLDGVRSFVPSLSLQARTNTKSGNTVSVARTPSATLTSRLPENLRDLVIATNSLIADFAYEAVHSTQGMERRFADTAMSLAQRYRDSASTRAQEERSEESSSLSTAEATTEVKHTGDPNDSLKALVDLVAAVALAFDEQHPNKTNLRRVVDAAATNATTINEI